MSVEICYNLQFVDYSHHIEWRYRMKNDQDGSETIYHSSGYDQIDQGKTAGTIIMKRSLIHQC